MSLDKRVTGLYLVECLLLRAVEWLGLRLRLQLDAVFGLVGCCIAYLEFPCNFGQGNPVTACVLRKMKTALFAISFPAD